MPTQTQGEILDVRPAGSKFVILSLSAPDVADSARPGQFVTLALGGDESSMLARRAFVIHQVQQQGVYGGSLDLAVMVRGNGSRWLSDRRRGDKLDVVGPLGKGFAIPRSGVSCVLVGSSYGGAPLHFLAQSLRERGCRVDMLIGAIGEDDLFGLLELKRLASILTVLTEDGSVGQQGHVPSYLEEVFDRAKPDVVYACGAMPLLAGVSKMASERRVFCQCFVETAMPCGIGVCQACVLPVTGDDGRPHIVRSCVEGPVFRGDRVRWSEIGTAPEKVLGEFDSVTTR